ncbi:hypothetical protein MRB53_014953 [Persea americana]|uniref:Uncharacterized protein n=1 Tax=Persea americana TaxID=3435 RepID=A0ACC2KCS4_PERAE|nr:hypothetical protein MRB53_014953 [Persea americana]
MPNLVDRLPELEPSIAGAVSSLGCRFHRLLVGILFQGVIILSSILMDYKKGSARGEEVHIWGDIDALFVCNASVDYSSLLKEHPPSQAGSSVVAVLNRRKVVDGRTMKKVSGLGTLEQDGEAERAKRIKMDHVTLAWAVVGNIFQIFATVRPILFIDETFNFQPNIHFANFMRFLASAWYGMPWITDDNLLFAMVNISCAALEISYLIKAYQEKSMYRRELLHTAKTATTVLAMFVMGCYLIFNDYYLRKLSAVLAALAGAVSLIPSKDTMQNCFMGVSSTAWMVYAQRRNDQYIFWPNLVSFLSAAFVLLNT